MNNSQYFYRTIIFTQKNNKVALVDINHTENITPLDEWLGIVISLADGCHTLQEMIEYMGTRYQSPPPNLEKTLLSVVERLLDGDMIKLSDSPVTLPYYLASPVEELDLEKAREQIQNDGYGITH